MAVFSGNGSNTAPSFTFSSDTNTGIYRPGSDQLALVTQGVDRVFINSTGNVGFNTTNPQSRVDVNGAIRASGSGNQISLLNPSTSGANFSECAFLQETTGGTRKFASIYTSPSDRSSGAYWGRLYMGTTLRGNESVNTNAITLASGGTTNSFTAFKVDGSEKSRITLGGQLLVGGTSGTVPSGGIQALGTDGAVYGRSFGTSGVDPVIDTGIFVGAYNGAIFEVSILGNPSVSSSSKYRRAVRYDVYITSGYTGSDISTRIDAQLIHEAAGGPSNNTGLSASFVLWDGSTEGNNRAKDANDQLRVKLTGVNGSVDMNIRRLV